MAIEREVDSLKYRKSDHLAGVDVEAIIHQKGKCNLIIADAYYNTDEKVCGKKVAAYVIKFTDAEVKPMVCNSTNRKKINLLVEKSKGLDKVSARQLPNWIGMQIELSFDANVVMAGEVVGGIRVLDTLFIKPPLELPSTNYDNCVKALKSGSYTIEQIESKYTLSQDVKTKLLEYGK